MILLTYITLLNSYTKKCMRCLYNLSMNFIINNKSNHTL